jgi:hypothetical protein
VADSEVLDAPEWPDKPANERKPRRLALAGYSREEATPAGIRKRYRLSNLRHVADELARVYRGMRHGEIRAEDGSRYAFVLSTLGKVIEAAEFEGRIKALEARGKEEGKP